MAAGHVVALIAADTSGAAVFADSADRKRVAVGGEGQTEAEQVGSIGVARLDVGLLGPGAGAAGEDVDRAESVRQAELDRVAARLAGLDVQQREAVEAVTRAIVAKLVHEPIVRVKDAAGSAKGDRLADSLRDLFDL
jgi:hypothetical protein